MKSSPLAVLSDQGMMILSRADEAAERLNRLLDDPRVRADVFVPPVEDEDDSADVAQGPKDHPDIGRRRCLMPAAILDAGGTCGYLSECHVC